MAEFKLVKGADTLVLVVAPIDVIAEAVIDGGGVVIISKFYDASKDAVIELRDDVLTKDYEEDGAKVCNVNETLGFSPGDTVELHVDTGLLSVDIVASVDETEKTVTLTNSTGVALAGSRLRQIQIQSGSTMVMVPSMVGERYLADDQVEVLHPDGTMDVTTIASRTSIGANSFIKLAAGVSQDLGRGGVLRRKLGMDLTPFTLYGATPKVNTEDWGWSSTLAYDSVTQSEILVGMRVRVEYEFNGGSGLMARYALVPRTVAMANTQ